MRIDVSSDGFDRVRDYTRVLLQQGRPILDRDWNEQTAIVLNQLRAVARAVYGYHGGPPGGACGFVPYENTDGKLWLRKGQYTIDGQLFECDRDYPYSDQKYWKPQELDEGQIQLVYLEAMEREVTAAEATSLVDSALPGVDVAARGQAIWRALHCDWSSRFEASSDRTSPDETLDTFCKNAIVEANEWSIRKRSQEPPSHTLAAAVAECKDLGNALEYRGNQCLRLECHRADTGTDKSEWKFSSDNGFALFKIEKIDGQKVTISLGNLTSWKPSHLDFVELLTTEQVQFDQNGVLDQVEYVPPHDDSNLESITRLDLLLKNPIQNKAKFLRAWHRKFYLPKFLYIREGDYWQYAARDTETDLETVKLKRAAKHYVPLALVQASRDGRGVKVLTRFQRIVGVPWREIDSEID